MLRRNLQLELPAVSKFSGFPLAASWSRSPRPAAPRGERLRSPASEALKRTFDLGSVSLALILLMPLLLTLAAVILLVQGRPILIRHKRVGRDGKPFFCLKFRTMQRDADEVLRRHLEADAAARDEWEASRKLRDDPRVTPLGHWLRKSSLDEFPQFLNVLRGEMSLVGPRPIVQDEIKHYGAQIQHLLSRTPGSDRLMAGRRPQRSLLRQPRPARRRLCVAMELRAGSPHPGQDRPGGRAAQGLLLTAADGGGRMRAQTSEHFIDGVHPGQRDR